MDDGNDNTRNAFSRRDLLKLGILGAGILSVLNPFTFFKKLFAQEAGPRKSAILEQARLNMGKTPESRRYKAVPSSCLQCIAVCGIIGYRDEETGRVVKIEGNPYSPNNRGMICAKGQAGINQVYDPDRILFPLKRVGERGEGRWRRISMKEALDEVASKLKEIYDKGPEHGKEFMFHYGRNRIGYATTHFCERGMGTKTIGSHTSICETAKFTGQEVSMGAHEDINDAEHSRFILNLGCNPLEAHISHAYFAQRIVDGKMNGAEIVTVDVRLSNTAAKSDQWIPIIPGTDAALLLAMCNVIMNEKVDGRELFDRKFIEKWTNVSVDELQSHLKEYTPQWASAETGIEKEKIRELAVKFASKKPSTCITYRGFVGHYNGAYNEFAAKLLDAICGNFHTRGGIFMKVAGKWFEPYEKYVQQKYKDKCRSPGKLNILDGEGLALTTHNAGQRVLEMIREGSNGYPSLYLTYVYNPAYVNGDCAHNIHVLKGRVNAEDIEYARSKGKTDGADMAGRKEGDYYIPYFACCDVAMSETASLADIILPDAAYLERWTLEAPGSYALTEFLQIRQPVAGPLGEAMDFQQMLIELARRIGGDIAALYPKTPTDTTWAPWKVTSTSHAPIFPAPSAPPTIES